MSTEPRAEQLVLEPRRRDPARDPNTADGVSGHRVPSGDDDRHLASMTCPARYRPELHATNPIERLNSTPERRTPPEPADRVCWGGRLEVG